VSDSETGYELPAELWERVLSPALVVYLDRVRGNVRTVIAEAGGTDRWRPHIKTTKIPAVFRELCTEGIRNFKCATTREAQELLTVLSAESVSGADLLVAYPLPAPALARMATLASEFEDVRISVLAEDPDAVASIPENLGVFVDVNPGMHRTGVPAQDFETILGVATRAGSRFRGVHYYDGHLHQDDQEERRKLAFECYDLLMHLVEKLEAAGVEVGELITSGTPSYRHALAYPGFQQRAQTIHRISPGTVVYHDLRSEELDPNSGLRPAALVHARVISTPNAHTITCDAGSKSVAAEAGDPVAQVIGRPNLLARTPSEEHLPLEILDRPAPRRGECVQLFPRHICPTVNLADEAILMDGSEFIGVVSVSARAHDLLFE